MDIQEAQQSAKEIEMFISNPFLGFSISKVSSIHDILKQLCQCKINLKIIVQPNSVCSLCNRQFNTPQEGIKNVCGHQFHKSCLSAKCLELSPGVDFEVLSTVTCQASGCGKLIHYSVIESSIGKQMINQIHDKLTQELLTGGQNANTFPLPYGGGSFSTKFQCCICMETFDLTKDGKTLDCDHRFCINCLRDIIIQNQAKQKIVCPQCQELPLEERYPNDPTRAKDDIEISLNIISDTLNEQQYDKFQKIKIQQMLQDSKQQLFQCSGFLKKVRGTYKLQDILIDKATARQMQDGKLTNLGFEVKNCENFFEIDKDNHQQFYTCDVCQFEQCLKCHERKHENMNCQQFKNWKLQNLTQDTTLKDLLEKNPETYKQCPNCKELIQKLSGQNSLLREIPRSRNRLLYKMRGW